jgi:predicted amidohydrolase
VVFDTPWGRQGLTICYDLRFGELYRAEALAGAKVIWAPAAFTLYTGKDHWDVLIRARAVENQVFMACPAQTGQHPGGSHTFGSAMIVDPWGTVIGRASEQEGVAVASVDFAYQEAVRQRVPALQHRRPETYVVREPAARR